MKNNKLSAQKLFLQTSKGKINLTVEVADDSIERSRGLMNRDRLDSGKGMWFVFEDEAPRTFWMKNTKIPLDAIFFNGEKKAVSLAENMQPCFPKTAKCPLYRSYKPAAFTLEVPAGFIKENGVAVGDEIFDF